MKKKDKEIDCKMAEDDELFDQLRGSASLTMRRRSPQSVKTIEVAVSCECAIVIDSGDSDFDGYFHPPPEINNEPFWSSASCSGYRVIDYDV